MSEFYTDMAATVTELLAEFGGAVTLKRTTGGSIDPVTGVVTPGTDDSKTTTGVLKRYPDKMIDGTLIQSGDRQVVLDPAVEPLMTDKLVLGGSEWRVVRIETAKPTDTALAYFVQVRR